MKKYVKFLHAIFIVSLLFSVTVLPAAAAPHIMVTDIKVSDPPVVSGKEFSLDYTLKNMAEKESIHGLMITFTANNSIFPVPGISSTQYLDRLAGNNIYTSTIRLKAAQGLSSGVYPITINITYENHDGELFSSSTETGITVEGAENCGIEISDITASQIPVRSGDDFTLNYTLHNLSEKSPLHNLSVTFESEDGIYPGNGISNTQHIGTIQPSSSKDGGDYKGFIKLRLDERLSSGLYPITIRIAYTSEGGETFETSSNTSIEVEQSTMMSIDNIRLTPGFNSGDKFRLSFHYENSGFEPINGLKFLLDGDVENGPIELDMGYLEENVGGVTAISVTRSKPEIRNLKLTVIRENRSGEFITVKVIPLNTDQLKSGRETEEIQPEQVDSSLDIELIGSAVLLAITAIPAAAQLRKRFSIGIK